MMRGLKGIGLAGPYALAAAVLVWIGFVVVLYGASEAIGNAVQGQVAADELAGYRLPSLTRLSEPLSAQEYQAVAKSLHPPAGIVVKAESHGLTIKASELVDYENWRLIVDEVLLSKRNYRWQVKALCTGECPEAAYSATLRATNVTLVVNQ